MIIRIRPIFIIFDYGYSKRKLQLIEWLAQVNDRDVIKKLVALKADAQKDWWDEISEEEKEEIEEGLAQADRGEIKTHKQVMAKYKKWL